MLESVVLSAALILGSAVDLRERRLPDWVTLPLITLGLLVTASNDANNMSLSGNLLSHVTAAVIGYGCFWYIGRTYLAVRRFDGLGLGDAKLLAAAGAWLGPLYLAPIVLLSALLALAWVVTLRLVGRRLSFNSALPFGPFLSCAFLCFWFAKLANWSLF